MAEDTHRPAWDSARPAPVEPPKHRLWGTYLDPSVEAAFEAENFELNVRRYVRFSVPLGIVAFLAYGLHDLLVIPEVYRQAWAIRFGIAGPLGVALVAWVFRSRRPERHQPAMLVFGMTVNLVVLWIGAIAPMAGFFIYTSYAIVFVTLGPFLARMNVKTQIVYTLLTLATFDAFDIVVTHSAPMVRFSLNLTILTLGAIGALSAYQLEVQSRAAFHQRRVIRDQLAAIASEQQKSESLLLNVLPKRIADRLKSGSGVIADRFASATVLFSDIVGFTQIPTRMPPDELVRRLDDVFSRFDQIAQELGLEKIKTIGDAYMVAGGIPTPRDDHAQAVCEMAIRMRDCIATLATDGEVAMAVRIGVHTGPVVAGVIGTRKFIYDVWGDTVNTASRMESHGIAGSIQVSEATYELTKDRFVFTPRGEIAVKGKGSMTTWILEASRAAPPS